MEDYLKAVFRMRDGTGAATIGRLSDEIGVSGPSTTNMVKRLHEMGLVRHTPYRGVELTAAGERLAVGVVRRQWLLTLYLAEALGFPWDEAHAEAERLEHCVSATLEARMDVALGHPTRDPNGDPILSRDGNVAELGASRLLDLEPGEGGVIARVSRCS